MDLESRILDVYGKMGVPTKSPFVQDVAREVAAFTDALSAYALVTAADIDPLQTANVLESAIGQAFCAETLALTTTKWTDFWGPSPMFVSSLAGLLQRRFPHSPDSFALRSLFIDIKDAIESARQRIIPGNLLWTRACSACNNVGSVLDLVRSSLGETVWHALSRGALGDERGVKDLLPLLKLLRRAIPLGELNDRRGAIQILVAT